MSLPSSDAKCIFLSHYHNTKLYHFDHVAELEQEIVFTFSPFKQIFNQESACYLEVKLKNMKTPNQGYSTPFYFSLIITLDKVLLFFKWLILLSKKAQLYLSPANMLLGTVLATVCGWDTLYSKQEMVRCKKSSRRLMCSTESSESQRSSKASSAFFSTHRTHTSRVLLHSAERVLHWRPAWINTPQTLTQNIHTQWNLVFPLVWPLSKNRGRLWQSCTKDGLTHPHR